MNRLFESELEKLKVNEQARYQIETLTKELVKQKLQEQIHEVESGKAQVKELKTKLEKLEHRFIDGEVSKNLFEKYSSLYEDEIRQIEANRSQS